jgi:hypothetical protein
MIVIVIARCEMSACLVQVGGYRACSTSESECEAIVVEYLSCEITVIVRACDGRSWSELALPVSSPLHWISGCASDSVT